MLLAIEQFVDLITQWLFYMRGKRRRTDTTDDYCAPACSIPGVTARSV